MPAKQVEVKTTTNACSFLNESYWSDSYRTGDVLHTTIVIVVVTRFVLPIDSIQIEHIWIGFEIMETLAAVFVCVCVSVCTRKRKPERTFTIFSSFFFQKW